MKTLQDLAKQYRKSAAEAIFPGLPYPSYRRSPNSLLKENPSGQGSRAFATGNLLTKFITSPQNAFDTIGRKIVNGFELVLDVSPSGAEYGKYVHFGTSRMLKRPFAEIGSEEPKFQSVLDEFLEGQSDEYVAEEVSQMDNMFKKAGFTIS
jgi:hypothetical protein